MIYNTIVFNYIQRIKVIVLYFTIVLHILFGENLSIGKKKRYTRYTVYYVIICGLFNLLNTTPILFVQQSFPSLYEQPFK